MQSKEFNRLMTDEFGSLVKDPVKSTPAEAVGPELAEVIDTEDRELEEDEKAYLKSKAVPMPKENMEKIRKYAERLRARGYKEVLVRERTIKKFGIRVYEDDAA